MKDKAIAYLSKAPLLHVEMLEAIYRGTAIIRYAAEDGVLLRETESGAYMISASDPRRGRLLVNAAGDGSLFNLHQEELACYAAETYALRERLECVQAVCPRKTPFPLLEGITFQKLDTGAKAMVLEHYHTLSDGAYIEKLLLAGAMVGAYVAQTPVGFAGIHPEGSIGLLEVFPEHRRKGYGSALVCYLANTMLEKGRTPFAQIVWKNSRSLALQKKLGFELSRDRVYWVF